MKLEKMLEKILVRCLFLFTIDLLSFVALLFILSKLVGNNVGMLITVAISSVVLGIELIRMFKIAKAIQYSRTFSDDLEEDDDD